MAVVKQRHTLRRLGSDDGFSGNWDGQWEAASSSEEYEYYRDLNDDGGGNQWLDSADSDSLTPEQIVTYVSLGLLGFMTLLCLACHPEVVSVPCRALRDWCFSRSSLVGGALEMNGGMDSDYAGGRVVETPMKKKKKKKKKKEEEEPSRSGDGGLKFPQDIGLL